MRRRAAAAATCRRGAIAAAVATSGVLAACGAKPPEALPAVEHSAGPPVHHRAVSRWTHVSRPDLPIEQDLPDLTEELRWPLSVMEHPALEPHYPIASVLAAPGITWTELCARGVQHRLDPSHKDELAYLGAWCDAAKHDAQAAVTALAPLVHSSVMGIANAVPLDLAFVLCGTDDAEHADQIMRGLGIRDPHIWDLLAASYLEVNKNRDAVYATSTAMQLDPNASDALACHRLTRNLMLGSSGYRDAWLKELTDRAAHKAPAAVCVELARQVPCALERDCVAYFKSKNIEPRKLALIDLYEHWPSHGDRDRWIDTAWRARRTWPANGSVELIRAALEAAVATTPCTDPRMEDVDRAADGQVAGVASLRPIADWVHTMLLDERACEAFHDRWRMTHP
jgi:hypothetical protein